MTTAATGQTGPRRIQPAPVDLSPMESKQYELEGAMLYYRQLIELRLQRGEEIAKDDDLVTKLSEACDAYQRFLEPHLSIEQIA